MTKSTEASIERDLRSALNSYKDSATAVKAADRAARQAIKDDPRTSDLAKRELLEALGHETKGKLVALKGEQESYVQGLRQKIEREFRGSQPSDAASVVSRRDAMARARKITDKHEALEVLQDAIATGDADLAHAVGARARNTSMFDVAELYQASYPETADSAAALAYVEANTSGAAYNVSNSITFSAPSD